MNDLFLDSDDDECIDAMLTKSSEAFKKEDKVVQNAGSKYDRSKNIDQHREKFANQPDDENMTNAVCIEIISALILNNLRHVQKYETKARAEWGVLPKESGQYWPSWLEFETTVLQCTSKA